MESGDIEHMQEKEMYKYLGHLQALQVRHKTVKQ
jgi:beta-lactamase superfamily II metal-dependent hydrolase